MSGKRYSDEFKAEAAKQVIDQGRSVREVSTRLGVSIDSLYAWVREQRKVPAARHAADRSHRRSPQRSPCRRAAASVRHHRLGGSTRSHARRLDTSGR
ncbi:transposase [Pseudoxanthomonas mexicana]|nr:transposase [Pseudoxanthomonas mexicana]UOV02545.1 transposase [Pseudoxanthomonas mexicana]